MSYSIGAFTPRTVAAGIISGLIIIAGIHFMGVFETKEGSHEHSLDLSEETSAVKKEVASTVSRKDLSGEMLDGVMYGALLSRAKLVDSRIFLERSNSMHHSSYPLLTKLEGNNSGSKLTVVLAQVIYTTDGRKLKVDPGVYARTPNRVVRFDSRGVLTRSRNTYWEPAEVGFNKARKDITERINSYIAQQ